MDIHPASVKIDYKPKHVDYSNLKGGNFIEIMNFFQLDGAEMALRGVRLTGVCLSKFHFQTFKKRVN